MFRKTYLKRMLFRTIILYLILFSLFSTNGAPLSADSGSDKLKEIGFDLCDGQPCFLGIIPGITSWNKANAIIDQYVTQHPEMVAMTAAFEGQGVGFYRNDFSAIEAFAGDAAITRFVHLSYREPLNSEIMVGDVIPKYGIPCGVTLTYKYVDRQFDSLWLHYDMLMVRIPIDLESPKVDRLDPSLHIEQLLIRARNDLKRPFNICYREFSYWQVLNESPWLGYVSIQDYAAF
ncbi:MAG: hypothetical protein IT324_16970 [Anaerolineae bacterium]|nr:hypothetical protein [Anaerolineae bacterium]